MEDLIQELNCYCVDIINSLCDRKHVDVKTVNCGGRDVSHPAILCLESTGPKKDQCYFSAKMWYFIYKAAIQTNWYLFVATSSLVYSEASTLVFHFCLPTTATLNSLKIFHLTFIVTSKFNIAKRWD